MFSLLLLLLWLSSSSSSSAGAYLDFFVFPQRILGSVVVDVVVVVVLGVSVDLVFWVFCVGFGKVAEILTMIFWKSVPILDCVVRYMAHLRGKLKSVSRRHTR